VHLVGFITRNIKAILKAYELFIYGDIYYFTNSFCKKMLKTETL